MTLGQLFPQNALAAADAGRTVNGLTADSRKTRPGFVFFAVPGTKSDGLEYAGQAEAQGAAALVAEGIDINKFNGMALVRVTDVRSALSAAAARFYPRQPEIIAAITGTSGKTSVASFARQIWAQAGLAAASVGTLGIVSPKGENYGSLTTPDPVSLHQSLDELAGEGVTHLALEASSHGLDQRRLDGVRLSAGAFTNLSRDHLDYHHTFEAYLSAKLRLFEVLLQPGQPAVIDADCEVAGQVTAACEARGLKVFTIGLRGHDLRLLEARPDGFATQLSIVHGSARYHIRLPLAGLFQTSNALVAAGLCISAGSDPGTVFKALESLQGAPGRLEHVGTHKGGQIFVDYAHKPDALAKALQALRPFVHRKLAVVAGCGGDRDPGKRPIMGKIAAEFADLVIITDDNPRTENPALIRAAMLAGAPGAAEIGDRAEAIRHAITALEDGDVLLVAGKGHETGQIVGDKVLPFSDHEAVARVLKELTA